MTRNRIVSFVTDADITVTGRVYEDGKLVYILEFAPQFDADGRLEYIHVFRGGQRAMSYNVRFLKHVEWFAATGEL